MEKEIWEKNTQFEFWFNNFVRYRKLLKKNLDIFYIFVQARTM